MKKTLAKVLALALCAVLLVTGTVFVTLAYLQGTSDVVRNTFSSAGVNLRLNETKVNVDGKPVAADGETLLDDPNAYIREDGKGYEYKLVPGSSYLKDPKVFVEEGSVPCYVYIAILDTMFESGSTETPVATPNGNIRVEESYLNADQNQGDYGLLSAQLKANGWEKLEGTLIADQTVLGTLGDAWNNGGYTLYYYNKIGVDNKVGVVDATNGEISLDIFDGFTILEKTKELNASGKVLEIIAFGIQSQGFNDATAAWTSTFGFDDNPMGS